MSQDTATPTSSRSADQIELEKRHSIYEQLTNAGSPQRNNRLCVAISDIHLTDGTVGLQNLTDEVWDNFFDRIGDTAELYNINEVALIIDGDFLDFIRTQRWAENNFYPWQREENPALFADIINTITDDILCIHRGFFDRLKNFDSRLKQQAPDISSRLIILLGNHDKELMLVNDALAKFYAQGLGISLQDISDSEREFIGRMYGDPEMFRDKSTAPYFPFYYADRGFRFFTTHGQWRDAQNNRAIAADNGLPGWKTKDGWKPKVWEQLRYKPFLEACFGDSVAAGVLSSFIYNTKKDLKSDNIHIDRLTRILDELDLYRPSYLAVKRIILEAKRMRSLEDKQQQDAAKIIEKNLQSSIRTWLSWDFTAKSASTMGRMLIRVARTTFSIMRTLRLNLELGTVLNALRLMDWIDNKFGKKTEALDTMCKFPGFQPPYTDHGFQIHGEGHTHFPLQEEANIPGVTTNLTYVNFGTWRDQIVPRLDNGYRRRGVLRTFNILDLKSNDESQPDARRFSYFTQDIMLWDDALDRINEKATATAKSHRSATTAKADCEH